METLCIMEKSLIGFFSSCEVTEDKYLVRRDKVPIWNELPYDFVTKNFAFSSGEQFQCKIEGEFKVEIMIPEEIPKGTRGATGVMKIEATAKYNLFLNEIWKRHPGNVFMTWHVIGLKGIFNSDSNNGEGEPGVWKAINVGVNRTLEVKKGPNGTPYFNHVYTAMKEIENISASKINFWRDEKHFTGVISVYLHIVKSPYQLAVEQQHFSKMRNLLEQRINTDLLLTTSGIRITCHRAILSTGSGKLATLLKMREEESTVDFMNHLSVECVKAFLDFVYCFDTTKVFSSMNTALEVLEAALDFEVFELVSIIQNYLNMKRNKEITGGQALNLFVMIKTRQMKLINNRAGDGNRNDDEGEGQSGANREDDNGNDDNETAVCAYVGNVDGGQKRNVGSDGHEKIKVKRMCDGLRAGSSSSAAGFGEHDLVRINENVDTGRTVNVGGTTSDSMRGNIMGNNEKCLELLEQRAIHLIEWYLRNQGNDILGSNEYISLWRDPEIARELSKVFARFYEAQANFFSDL